MYEDKIRIINTINESLALTKIKNANKNIKIKASLKINNKLNIYVIAVLETETTKFINEARFWFT